MQLLQPQEVEVFYILPSIRREMSIALKEKGFAQKKIAELLGVTGSAVSQYLHEKRAQMAFPKEFQTLVRESTKNITDTQSMVQETQRILKRVKEEKLICKLHAKLTDVPHNCEVCFK